MADVIELQVFYRMKAGDVRTVKQIPTAQETAAIKLDVQRMVQKIIHQGNAEYWYLVVKVRKTDGTFGYRTMIPKTLI